MGGTDGQRGSAVRGHQVCVACGAWQAYQVLWNAILEVHVGELLRVEAVPDRILGTPAVLGDARRGGHDGQPENPVLVQVLGGRTEKQWTGSYSIKSVYLCKVVKSVFIRTLLVEITIQHQPLDLRQICKDKAYIGL